MTMNKLSVAKRATIINLLVEGVSLRAISRITGASINTITKLLEDAGNACAEYHDETVRNVRSKRVQADEIWSFTYAKQANVKKAKKAPADAGDTWTWTAIDADHKLIISWHVGPRDLGSAYTFMMDLAERLATRVQLTTDGLQSYLSAIEDAFGADVDYSQLIKLYGLGTGGREAVQPREVPGHDPEADHWRPGPQARQHVLRRAAEPHDADEHASVHAAHQRLLEEAPAPRLPPCAVLRVLQLLPHSQDAASVACDGFRCV